ncbi:MAG: WxcM-like domain-containing protein, partial [Candidatus Thiodiazotropha taylori]|nr:WxcM-like domain-containing protein [Candidatus Thiodiazotropha taylori]
RLVGEMNIQAKPEIKTAILNHVGAGLSTISAQWSELTDFSSEYIATILVRAQQIVLDYFRQYDRFKELTRA